MSGYIEAGYVIVLGSLSVYAVSLVTRERVARRRASHADAHAESPTLPVVEPLRRDEGTP